LVSKGRTRSIRADDARRRVKKKDESKTGGIYLNQHAVKKSSTPKRVGNEKVVAKVRATGGNRRTIETERTHNLWKADASGPRQQHVGDAGGGLLSGEPTQGNKANNPRR